MARRKQPETQVPDPRPWLTPADIAERLQIPERSVREYLTKGELCSYVRVRRHLRVKPAALEQWLENNKRRGPSAGVRVLYKD